MGGAVPRVVRGGERGEQRPLAAGRQRQQVVVVEAEQRRLQHAGEAEIVVGQQRGAAGGDEIEHGDVTGDVEPVGAGHGDPALLQRADHRLEEGVAGAHEDEDVAGPHRPLPPAAALVHAIGRERRAQRLNLARDAVGEFARGVVLGQRVDGDAPFRIDIAGFGLDARPHLDERRQALLDALVAGPDVALLHQPVLMRHGGEHAVDGREDPGGRAERGLQSHPFEGLAAGTKARLERRAHALEHQRGRALEREDRLLVVADDEEGAIGATRTGTGGEVGGETLEDLPLRLAGVLRLVDQHVVDAAVELVQDPAGIGAAQQLERAVDEIVEVEQAAGRLGVLVARGHGVDDLQQGRSALCRLGDLEFGSQPHETLLFRAQLRLEAGMDFHQTGRDQALALVARAREVDRRQQLEQGREPRPAGQRLAGSVQAGRLVAVALRSYGEDGGQRRPPRGSDALVHHRPPHRFGIGVAAAETRGQARSVGRAAGGIAQRHGLGDETIDAECAGEIGHQRQRRAEAAGGALRLLDDGTLGRRHQLAGAQFVRHGETRRHVGLEREKVQQPLAEGVDRLDLQPAGRLHRTGEETARGDQVGRRRRRRAGRDDGGAQLAILPHRPVGEIAEHAGRHLRRRRLGEGEAEDLGRRRAGEQQPDHALRQHVGLARAGVGGHPDRRGGVGCAHLALAQMVGHEQDRGDGFVHGAPSSSPASDHSRTRAR